LGFFFFVHGLLVWWCDNWCGRRNLDGNNLSKVATLNVTGLLQLRDALTLNKSQLAAWLGAS
jgi:hypothetical protein